MRSSSALSYLILTIAVVYAFALPQYQNVNVLSVEKEEVTKKLDKVDVIEDKKNALLAEFNEISSREVNMVKTLVPESFDYVKLAYDIDSAASRYGISISNVATQDNEVTSVSETEMVNSSPYRSREVYVSFEATYDAFGKLVTDLEKSLRVLDIISLKITTKEGSIYDYELGFRTHWANNLNVNQDEQ